MVSAVFWNVVSQQSKAPQHSTAEQLPKLITIRDSGLLIIGNPRVTAANPKTITNHEYKFTFRFARHKTRTASHNAPRTTHHARTVHQHRIADRRQATAAHVSF